MMGSMRTERANPSAPTRIGSGTRSLRNYSLWSYYALCAIWPLTLAGFVADQRVITGWTLAALGAQALFSLVCAFVMRSLVDAAVDGREPRVSSLPGVFALYAVCLALTIAGFLPSEAEMSPVTLALLLPTLGLGSAASALLPGRRAIAAAAAGTAIVLAGTGLSRVLHPIEGSSTAALLTAAALPTALTLVALISSIRWTISILVSVGSQERLDLMRADLAVAEERLRIARDLHDLFGRTLTAVALKSDLAAELAEAEGAPRAAVESRSVQALADSALKEVRATLAGYRTPDLGAEVAGAASLLTSAAVDVRVLGDPSSVPDPAAPLLALVVREAATNVVRHSRATSALLRFEVADGLARAEIRNDGAPDARADSDGSGLVSLRARLEDEGGTLDWSAEAGTFRLVATAPVHSAVKRLDTALGTPRESAPLSEQIPAPRRGADEERSPW